MNKIVGIIYVFMLFGLQLKAQSPIEKIKFNGQEWEVSAREYKVENYMGKEALALKNGVARLSEAKLKNGIIEFDISFAEKRQFSGVLFRMEDGRNYEEFYLRPHQSDNPDANQYTPVYYGNSAWQLYYGEGYATPYAYKFDQWMHVKILVKDDQAEFYIDDMEKPILRAFELKRTPIAGPIGFKSSREFTYYANLIYQITDDIQFRAEPHKRPAKDSHIISSYKVSHIIQEKTLTDKKILANKDIQKFEWKTYNTEDDGTLNLSQVGARSPEDNTIFVKFDIKAEAEELRQLNFGYSDRIRLYCNGQLLYSGQNEYVSRDYRYLGTIGYFDAVYLPLKKGNNEILMAVSENFGGWGIKARLEKIDGLKLATSEE